MAERTKLLIVAPEKRDIKLEEILNNNPQFQIYRESINGDNFIGKISEYKPNIAVVNAMHNGGSTDLIRKINKNFSDLPILVIIPGLKDQLERYRYFLPYICSGARGYVMMNGSYQEIRDEIGIAVSRLIQGSTYPIDQSLERQIGIIKKFEHNLGTLTKAERNVFTLAVAYPLSNKEIANRLHRSVRTVEVHLDRVYKKLGFRDKNDMLFHSGLIMGAGYSGKK